MRGNFERRGKKSWRLKFDIGTDPMTRRRRTRRVTSHQLERNRK